MHCSSPTLRSYNLARRMFFCVRGEGFSTPPSKRKKEVHAHVRCVCHLLHLLETKKRSRKACLLPFGCLMGKASPPFNA